MSWSEWFQSQKQERQVPRGPSFEHFFMLAEAAKAGLGIALVPDSFVHSEIESGELVRIGKHALVANRAYYTIFEPSKNDNQACRHFRQWLQSEVR